MHAFATKVRCFSLKDGTPSYYKYARCMWSIWGLDTGSMVQGCFLPGHNFWDFMDWTLPYNLFITPDFWHMDFWISGPQPRVCLLRVNFWGEGHPNLQASLDQAYLHFRNWLKRNKLYTSQPPFKSWMVLSLYFKLVSQLFGFRYV